VQTPNSLLRILINCTARRWPGILNGGPGRRKNIIHYPGKPNGKTASGKVRGKRADHTMEKATLLTLSVVEGKN
jgi:hypothetical protein